MIKRTLVATAAAAVLVGGSAVTAGSAQAAPYPDTVRTTTSAQFGDRVIKSGKTPYLRVKVTAGTGKPEGRVTVNFKGRVYSKPYDGGTIGFSLAKVVGGKKQPKFYTARVSFSAPNKSVYKNSSDSATVKVLPKN